jgi:hypothetical protein
MKLRCIRCSADAFWTGKTEGMATTRRMSAIGNSAALGNFDRHSDKNNRVHDAGSVSGSAALAHFGKGKAHLMTRVSRRNGPIRADSPVKFYGTASAGREFNMIGLAHQNHPRALAMAGLMIERPALFLV